MSRESAINKLAYMDKERLQHIAHKLGLSASGSRRTLVYRIVDMPKPGSTPVRQEKAPMAARRKRKGTTVKELQALARERGLKVSGTKKALMDRLNEHGRATYSAPPAARTRRKRSPNYRAKRGGAYLRGYGTATPRRGRPRKRRATTRTLQATLERLAKTVGIGRGRRKAA